MNLAEKIGLGLLGLGVVGMGVLAEMEYEPLATGINTLDRFAIRGRVLLYATLYGVPPKAMMAIFHNESDGNPDNFLGDEAASGGPSIGPGQVYRKTAKDLGLWSPPEGISDSDERALYASLAEDLDFCIKAACAVFKSKLKTAGGDVAQAIALYNGTPSNPAVQKYQAKALAFLSDTYGDEA